MVEERAQRPVYCSILQYTAVYCNILKCFWNFFLFFWSLPAAGASLVLQMKKMKHRLYAHVLDHHARSRSLFSTRKRKKGVLLHTVLCNTSLPAPPLIAYNIAQYIFPTSPYIIAIKMLGLTRAVQERGRRHVLCDDRARLMHQRARSGASHGCKWDQHGILNCVFIR